MSLGISHDPIYKMAARALSERRCGGTLIDLGCGVGNFRPFVRGAFETYIGVDAVPYAGFPPDARFIKADLNKGDIALPDNAADAVVAVETIEHLENPRAFLREMTRLAKPGGWVLVTTPNNLSLHSLLFLILKRTFSDFQDACYPAHITALLETDLRRIAAECGLSNAAVAYSQRGRIPLTPWHYPGSLSRRFPRALSNSLALIGRKA